MTDLHTHVLPGMDDGSASVEESLHMLSALAGQGVDTVAATPHFYAGQNSPSRFLARRAVSASRLRQVWQPGLPRLVLGAEVCYFEGISRVPEVQALAIEGSGLLLVEMPFTRWSGRIVQELIQLHTQGENRVLLAHIERYLHAQEPAVWERLLRAGVLMQANAGFFLHWRIRHRAVRMLREGRIHLLGSDTHNMSTRPPELGRALQGIGPEGRQRLAENERLLLPRWEGEGPV